MLELPFDPIKRSLDVEKVVMRGDSRRYYRFRYAKFYGGIATADAVGCNLLCAYCWNYSGNLKPSKAGAFYSPREVTARLRAIAEGCDCDQYRISGAEPILGAASMSHLADVIRSIEGAFIVETNGLMLGYDKSLIDMLSPLSVHVAMHQSPLQSRFRKDYRIQGGVLILSDQSGRIPHRCRDQPQHRCYGPLC